MLDMISTNWDFPVELQPVFDQRGNEIAGTKAAVRTDTNDVLAVHGSRYRMVTHSTVMNSMMDAVKQANISEDYRINYSVTDNGAKFRATIVFPNLVIEPVRGDITQLRVNVFNSYDAFWPLSESVDGMRLACLNGMVLPMAITRARLKHTANINIEGMARKITDGVHSFFNERERWAEWMNIKVSDEMAELFFKTTLAKAQTLQKMKPKVNETQLENLLGIWQTERRNMGANKWALYNTMTYWSTHTDGLKNPLAAQRDREEKVYSALNSKQWNLNHGNA